MLKKEVAKGNGGRVIVMDSITKVSPEDKDAIVVCASHGGTSSGEFALEVPLKAVIFNDAGVGKDNAGIAALDMLQKRGARRRHGGAHQRAHWRFARHVGERRVVACQRGRQSRRACTRGERAGGAHETDLALMPRGWNFGGAGGQDGAHRITLLQWGGT